MINIPIQSSPSFDHTSSKVGSFFSKIRSFLTAVLAGLKSSNKIPGKNFIGIFTVLSRKEIISFAVLITLVLASSTYLIFASTTQDQSGVPDYGGEYSEGLVGQPKFLNPVLAPASTVDTELTKIIYAQLLKFDKDLSLKPELAEDLPTTSADQKTYTLKLKPNLKWQDGRPILADDVIYTITTIQDSEYDSPLRANWSRVKVEKVDDLTIRFVLREVSASFVTNFTLGVLPKHIWENYSPNTFRLTDSNLKPIGSGPFVLREIKKTPDGVIRSLTLQANELYLGGRPYLDRIVFKFYDDQEGLLKAYQTKDIQGLGYLPFDKKTFLEESDKYNRTTISLPQYQAVFFNLSRNQTLAEKAVRQALWLSTDRKEIINEVYMGLSKEAFGPIPVGNLGYNPEIEKVTHFNLDEASDILNRGGWIMDPNTQIRMKKQKPLEFNLATNEFILNVKTAQNLQTQWSKIGAVVHLNIVSAPTLQQEYIRPRNYDALLFAENTGADPDPYPFWHSSQSRDPGLNLSGFSNSEVDRLLLTARQTNDVNVRSQNYKQFQTIITREIPAIFLTNTVYVYNTPKKLKGIELSTIIHPAERFLDIKNWYINTK